MTQTETHTQEVIEELRGQLENYGPDQYPVQHATARFHLGSVLIHAGQSREAARHLNRATQLFPRDGMAVEHAKATNMLGVALRNLDEPAAAAELFERASEIFAEEDQRVEEAAAHYNRGLVLLQVDEVEAAREAFTAARETFIEADARQQAAAAGRELGTLLLNQGELEEAAEILEQAVEWAADAGEQAALGSASNTLGLVHRQAGDLDAARAAFQDAVGGHPRSVRPEGYAMAKANLALVYEESDYAPMARLVARQARDTPGVSGPVARQARNILERLGDEPGDLHRVLDDEPQDQWTAVLRGELRRVADLDEDDQRRHARSWVEGQAARDERQVDLAEAYLDVLLELRPKSMDAIIRAIVDATGELEPGAAKNIRRATARGMACFHVPQMMRLRETFNEMADELGQEATWD